MQNSLAPIILFVYDRPKHTSETLVALSKNELSSSSILIIYSDGPKENASPDNLNDIAEVRRLIREKQWCKEVRVIESETNKGLALSVHTGVSSVLTEFEKVIVLEDDLVTSKHFLTFMNEALNKYENENNVISISGYFYPIKNIKESTFFIQGADCWGWATWKRGWKLYNPDGQMLYESLKNQGFQRKFDFNNTYPYFEMLKAQINGQNNSWAIKWYASAFLNNKLTLYPYRSLVHNIGNDNTGRHIAKIGIFDNKIDDEKIEITNIKLSENSVIRKKIEKFFKKKYSPGILERINRKFLKLTTNA